MGYRITENRQPVESYSSKFIMPNTTRNADYVTVFQSILHLFHFVFYSFGTPVQKEIILINTISYIFTTAIYCIFILQFPNSEYAESHCFLSFHSGAY